MAQEEVVLLRVQLDEGKTTDRLKALVLDMEKTKEAQKLLNQQRKEGQLTDEAYAAENVRLQQQMKAQRTEAAALTKNLELWDKATKGVADSYQAQQAQLSLAQRQYQLLAGSAANSTEETKALSGVIGELRGTLKTTDADMGLFVREIGNYKGAVEPLIAELKRLEIQQEATKPDSKAYQDQALRIVGFQQRINQVSAEAGLSYEQTQAKLTEYGNKIAPVVQELVKLEQQQADVVEGSEQYNRIGFQMQKLKKDISEVPAENKKLGASLLDVASTTDTLGGSVEQLTGFQQRYAQAQNLVTLAMGTSTGAARILRVALLATGVGAFIAVVATLITYFTQTAAGARVVEQVMAQVGATLDVITDRIGNLGEAVKQVFDGNFSQAAETAKASFRGVGDEIERETRLALNLSKARQQLERDEINNIDTNKRLLNQVERLKNIRDDEFNSLAVRKKANEDAYKVELEREKTLADLAKRRVDILAQEINRRGGLTKVTNDQLKEFKEAQNEYSDIQEDAAGKQNELITNRFQLNKEGLDKQKEAEEKAAAEAKARAEKALAARQSELKTQLGFLDLALTEVQKNSEEELNILRRRLATARTLELTAKDLTVRQKSLIDAKYEADSLKLTEDFAQRRLVAELTAAQSLLNAQLAGAREGGEEELQLRQQLIERQLQQELAGLDKSQDNTAKEAQLRAAARKAQADLEFNQSLNYLENRLQAERNRINQEYAQGLITKQQQEDSLLALERAGTQARLVVEQDYARDTRATREQLAEQAAAARDQKEADDKAALDRELAIQDARMQAATAVTDTVIELFGEETAAGQAAIALKKTFALAEIAINLQREISAIGTAAAANPLNIPTAGIAGLTQNAILTGIAIAKAAVLAAKVLVFRDGGIAEGPSHEEGGIPLYYRGRPAGIEIEGGEPVLTAGVSRNPALLAAASAINVAAGGRALTTATLSPYMAAGGVTASALVQQSVRGGMPGIDYDALGQATAKALKENPPINRWTDFKSAEGRNDFTDGMANS